MPSKSKDSDELKIILLEAASYKLYEVLNELAEGLDTKVDIKEVNDILVNALAINLGHVIGQLDVKNQKKYSALAIQMIKDHSLLSTIQKDINVYGQIGRA